MAQAAARAINFFGLGLIVVMGMGATLTWAQSGDLPPSLPSPPPIDVPTNSPTYPPPSSLAPPPLPQWNDTLDACLDSYPELSIGARMVKNVSTDYQFNSSATNITLFMPTNEAFITFAASLHFNLTENLTDMENIPYPSTWQQAFRYHMIPRQLNPKIFVNAARLGGFTQLYDTDLGTAQFAKLRVTCDKAANITLNGTSSSARVLQDGIKCGNSILYIIDTVLQYWYPDLDAALTPFATKLRDGLHKTGLMSALATANGTIFAPYDNAFTYAVSNYGYDFTTNVDTLKYHVLSQKVQILQTVVKTDDYMTLNSKALQVKTLGNGSPPTVETLIAGGVRTNINLQSPLAIPVGVAPSFYIYTINAVLIPTYTSVLQALDLENFKYLHTIVSSDETASSVLKKDVTLFAPTDQAIRAYVTKVYGSNTEVTAGVFKDKENRTKILNNHIVERAYSFPALVDLAKKKASIDAIEAKLWLSPPVNVRAKYTSANVVAPNNISVLYGKMYIHAIDYVLSPYLDSDGSGTAAPSLLVLGLSLLVACLLAAVR